MSIIVSITLAIICFTNNGIPECDPVLLGKKSSPTPLGEFNLVQRITNDPGYNGDILQFFETDKTVYAIHRVWLLKPDQKRLDRLQSKNIQEHFISAGCINVMPEVYDKLINCCTDQKLIIH